MTAGAWWCRLAWLGGDDATPGVLVEVDSHGVVTTVSAGVAEADAARATRLDGLTLPGLVNAHSHAFHRALRGWTHAAGEGSFWTWRQRMYAVAARLDPDGYRRLATAVYAEMAQAGITAVGEFHYLHHDVEGRPYPGGDPMAEALVDAASTAGIRLTLIDTCYLTGGIGEAASAPQRRFGDGDAEGWASRVERTAASIGRSPTVRVGAAVHSVRAVPPASIAAVAAWARRHDAPLHAHVSEQPAENDACLAAYDKTPTRLLADLGAVDARFTAVHATHLDGADVDTLGAAGAWVCLCPTTERDLADGIGPAAALRAAGVELCLGSDSHAVIDLLEEARAVELDERLATGRRGSHAPAALLRAATEGGAGSIGWPDTGRVEVGALADLTTIGLGGVRLAGTLGPGGEGAAAAAVFAGAAADVTDVVVGGRQVVAGRRHLAVGDVGAALDRAISGLWAGEA